MYRHLAIIVACGFLTACGSSLGNTSPFAAQAQAIDEGIQTIFNDTRPVSSFSDLPDHGTSSYDGKIGVVIDDEAGTIVIGDIAIDVDFGATTNPVTGSADSFISVSDEQFSGSLALANTAFETTSVATGVGFTGDLDGTLDGPETGQVIVDTDVEATFATPIGGAGEISGAYGLVTGDVTTSEGTFDVLAGEVFVSD
ncbi:MAG: hypothetical protein AAGL89_17255 [Pseudomonadota bacterium]